MKKITICSAVLFSIALIYSCTKPPYATTNQSYNELAKDYAKLMRDIPVVDENDSIKQPAFFAGTINFGLRKPNFVIIHHTAQNSCDETLKTFTTAASKVSAHYVICKEGVVHHMLNDYFRAQHAGVSRWGNLIDVNSSSIGIEIDNNGFEAFTDAQIKSLLSLLATLKKKYDIPTANFIGHGDIAPRRKNDPNYRFPWKILAENGFGLWYDEVRDSVPVSFNHIQALRIVGYDVKDTTAAIRAFKRHFMQDTTKYINDADKNVLFNLQKKYM